MTMTAPTPDQPITRAQFLVLQTIQHRRGHRSSNPDVVVAHRWNATTLLARRDGDAHFALSTDPVPALIDQIAEDMTRYRRDDATHFGHLAETIDGRSGHVTFQVHWDNDEESIRLLNPQEFSDLSYDTRHWIERLIGEIHHEAPTFSPHDHNTSAQYTFSDLTRHAREQAAACGQECDTLKAAVRQEYTKIAAAVQD